MLATSGRGLGSRLETTVTGRDPREPTSDPVTSPSPFCRSWSPLEGESVMPPVPSRCLTWAVATYGCLVSAGYYIVHVFCLHLYLLYYSNTRKSRNRVQCISSDLRGLLIEMVDLVIRNFFQYPSPLLRYNTFFGISQQWKKISRNALGKSF
jgi:hypothetical protein